MCSINPKHFLNKKNIDNRDFIAPYNVTEYCYNISSSFALLTVATVQCQLKNSKQQICAP